MRKVRAGAIHNIPSQVLSSSGVSSDAPVSGGMTERMLCARLYCSIEHQDRYYSGIRDPVGCTSHGGSPYISL
jgi:hypothetical protein